MTQSPYRWVIVAAGGFLGCVAIGAMFSLPVFLVPLTAATGWSRTGVSSAMTIGFLTMAASGLAWGLLVDRIGPGRSSSSARSCSARALALASRATSLFEFQLVFGALVRRLDLGDPAAPDGDASRAGSRPSAVSPSRWFRPGSAWRP